MLPNGDVAVRVGSVNAESVAKASFFRAVARKRNNCCVASSVLIICINRVNEEHSVENVKRSDIATSYTEYYKILALLTGVLDFKLQAVHTNVVQILGLWEEEILCRAVCVVLFGKCHTVLVLCKLCNVALVGWDIKYLVLCDSLKKRVDL